MDVGTIVSVRIERMSGSAWSGADHIQVRKPDSNVVSCLSLTNPPISTTSTVLCRLIKPLLPVDTRP